MLSPATQAQRVWRERLEQELPHPADLVGRNRAYTTAYARWYLDSEGLLKWSGMAVAASLAVGKVLAWRHRPRWVEADVARVCETNRRIFQDVGWAHAAWLHPEGGIQAVEAGLEPLEADLLSAWRQIDRARDSGTAEDAWSGAAALLHHEQNTHVQALFSGLGALPRVLFSALASTNYRDVVGPSVRERSFLPDRLRAGSRRPDIGNFSERWAWIEARALPLWRELDEEHPTLRACMAQIAAEPVPVRALMPGHGGS